MWRRSPRWRRPRSTISPAQAAKAGAKAAGVVIDDAAVTPRYVVGFSPARELPIVWKIALGSLRNKLLILLPAALAAQPRRAVADHAAADAGRRLSLLRGRREAATRRCLPHAGACARGRAGRGRRRSASARGRRRSPARSRPTSSSRPRSWRSRWRRIPAGSLLDAGASCWRSSASASPLLVYGGVALIVKADDVGLAMARNGNGSAFGGLTRGFGRGAGARHAATSCRCSASVGTAAMIWVGGGIIVHGLEDYGVAGPAHLIHDAPRPRSAWMPWSGAVGEWLVSAVGSGLVGLVVGAALIPLVSYGLAPAWAAHPPALNRLSPPACGHRPAPPRAAPAPRRRSHRNSRIRPRYG